MIRVDQAGEFGATRIYAGQLAVLPPGGHAAHVVTHMAAGEERHLDWFNREMAERGVRPTALTPLWDRAGFALGAVTALISPEAAMACTEAVETEIDRHYTQQRDALADSDPRLSAAIADFQADEVEHRDTAREHGADKAVGYPLLTAAIRLGCRAAIALTRRV